MKDYHSKVNILHSRKYNGNGYRLLVQQYLWDHLGGQALAMIYSGYFHWKQKENGTKKIFLSVYFPAYSLYNMYTWRHEILVTALSKSQSLLVIGTVNPVLSPPYQISPPL